MAVGDNDCRFQIPVHGTFVNHIGAPHVVVVVGWAELDHFLALLTRCPHSKVERWASLLWSPLVGTCFRGSANGKQMVNKRFKRYHFSYMWKIWQKGYEGQVCFYSQPNHSTTPHAKFSIAAWAHANTLSHISCGQMLPDITCSRQLHPISPSLGTKTLIEVGTTCVGPGFTLYTVQQSLFSQWRICLRRQAQLLSIPAGPPLNINPSAAVTSRKFEAIWDGCNMHPQAWNLPCGSLSR
ncbi:hypothetical protein DFH07DRAFT_779688 [Mycena maculata]|uniref:Uncharacterized protein n=1 Tax=Mycena maculata TaxID=230809 RepID=A0AAD7MYG6_9AGAR|nr:hypothetical protein DFH07DRAFT_779688 [Mycena maculata]